MISAEMNQALFFLQKDLKIISIFGTWSEYFLMSSKCSWTTALVYIADF